MKLRSQELRKIAPELDPLRLGTGWKEEDPGIWYYLNPDGSMAVNTVIDGLYSINSEGQWIE